MGTEISIDYVLSANALNRGSFLHLDGVKNKIHAIPVLVHVSMDL